MKIILRANRGDIPSYIRFAIAFSLSILLFLGMYHNFDPLLMQMWGARNNWYLETYRVWSAKVWRLLNRSSSSWLFLYIPVLWLLSSFMIQFGLKKELAKLFNTAHLIFIIALSVVAAFCFFELFMLPLG